MNEHRCENCEHEKECLNMVCFYELLEKEEGKIRADERIKVLDEVIDILAIACQFDDENRAEMKEYILKEFEEQK